MESIGMCGITGFWGEAARSEDFVRILGRMVPALAHRGPDGSGTWFDPEAGVGLGHARLAVVDLSPAGDQPMVSADGRYVLVHNGEAYNFQALRAQLDGSGQTPPGGWRGHSDTEVILAAVSAWGLPAAVERLVGMFAFGLWDRAEQRLTLVRDRLGIKPLYYGYLGPNLVFGSELKALRRHPAWDRPVDRDVLALYFRYLYIPTPYCVYQGLQKLESGSWLSFSREDVARRRMPEPVRYWSLEEQAARGMADPLEGDEEEITDVLEGALSEAVRLRLVSDVPLGAFLSGGVDSSAVAALMQSHSSRPVKTFTIGSPDAGYDEAGHARRVAAHLGTEHTELLVDEARAREVVPLLPRFYDEPFADASQIPTFLVSRMAREHVTVCLSGDGGDEAFGGYNRYLLAPALWGRLEPLPPLARRIAAGGMRRGGEAVLHAAYKLAEPLLPERKRHRIFRDKVQKVAEAMAATDRLDFFHSLVSYWREPERLVAGARPPATRFTNLDPRLASLDFPSLMMALDQTTYLPDDILTKVDRASMAVSLEARVPVLDHRVVETAWRIPVRFKIGGLGKHILRRVLYRHVPAGLVERPKQGFGVPLDSWLRGPLKGWAEELLRPELLRRQGVLNPEPVAAMWQEHESGKRNRQYHLWAVLMFQSWLAEYGA